MSPQEGGGRLGGTHHPGEDVVRGGGGRPRARLSLGVSLPLPRTGRLGTVVIIQDLILKQFDEEVPLLLSTGGVGLCLASVSS